MIILQQLRVVTRGYTSTFHAATWRFVPCQLQTFPCVARSIGSIFVMEALNLPCLGSWRALLVPKLLQWTQQIESLVCAMNFIQASWGPMLKSSRFQVYYNFLCHRR